MIFSVEFRHQTEERYLRENITLDCLDIASYFEEIEAMVVVFYKQPQRASLVTCHLTLIMRGQRSFHIYEHERSSSAAFETVFQKLLDKLGGAVPASGTLQYLQQPSLVGGGAVCQR